MCAPVQSPGLTAIKKARESNCLVHVQLGSELDVVLVQRTRSQSTDCFACSTDHGLISLLREPSLEILLPRYLDSCTVFSAVSPNENGGGVQRAAYSGAG